MFEFGRELIRMFEEYKNNEHERMTKYSISAKQKYEDLMVNNVPCCPICGSKRIIELPAPSVCDGNNRKHTSHTTEENPLYEYECEYHCLSCEHDYGSYPKIVTKTGELEDVRTYIEMIRYYEHCGRDGQRRLSFENNNDGLWLKVFNRYSDNIMQREMASDEWIGLLDRLYGKLYLHEWEEEFCNPHIYDGRMWSLKVFFRDGHVHEYNGQNAYPPYWEGLCVTLRPFFLEYDRLW